VITIFRNRSRDEIVFRVARRSLINLSGVESRSSTAGPIESMVCSNKRVKSDPERHPWTTGPKRSSFDGRHVEAMVNWI